MSEKLLESEISDLIAEFNGWILNSGILEKKFIFASFFEALSFVVKVGMLAEKIEHHPDILLFNYNNVLIKTTTFSLNGISIKDIELIKQIDRI